MMPLRGEYQLAREGITPDTLLRALRSTVFNPVLTVPLLLAARFTQQGKVLAANHALVAKYLRTAAVLGILNRLGAWLDDAVTNNWTNDFYDWKKEVVVVTGGSDGIGKEVVLLLAEKDIKVAVLDVQGLTYEAPPTVQYFHADLASHSSIMSAANAVKSSLGNPTVLINNAGTAHGKSILESTERNIRLTFNVNTLSHYFLTQAFLPHMISSNHGMIVTVASLAAYVAAPSMVDYASSKAASLAFHEGLTAELATLYKAPRVRTVIMCQNYTRTKLFEGFHGNALYPETVADEIVKAVLSGNSGHILLPVASWLTVPRLRGFPLWMQYGLRKRLVIMMAKWQGRQVPQPGLEYTVGKEGIEESGVLGATTES